MGGIDFNESFGSLGGNPGSFGYWVMLNTNPGTSWTKVSGTISGFGNSTGQFKSGTKYMTPMALLNYSGTAAAGSRVTRISGWRMIRTDSPGSGFLPLSGGTLTGALTGTSATFTGNLGLGTTAPDYKLDVSGGAIAIRGNVPGTSLRFDSTDGTTATSRNALYVDVNNIFQIGNTNYASNNIIGDSVVSGSLRAGNDGYDSTPGGTAFSHTLAANSGSARVVNFDGTGANPSVWWTNDNDRIGAIDGNTDGLAFWTNNSSGTWNQNFYIKPTSTIFNENVGIGTTTPGAKLNVSGMSLFVTSLTNNDDHQNSPISIRERGNVAATQTSNIYAPNLNFHWGGRVSNSLWMDDDGNLSYGPYSGTGVPSVSSSYGLSSGKLGAGTSVPAVPLHAIGASNEIARIQTSSATGSPYISFYQSTTRRSFIEHDDVGDNLNIASEYGNVIIMTGTGGTETEKMVIQADGDVGIGVTNPVNKLQVGGKIYSSGDIQANSELRGATLRLPTGGNSSASEFSEMQGFIDINVNGTVYVIPYYEKE